MPGPGRFTPWKTRYPFYRRLGGSQGQSGQVRKISPPPGFDPPTTQPVASRYTDWAIPAQLSKFDKINNLIKLYGAYGKDAVTYLPFFGFKSLTGP